jgi:vacuolar-type H+-ATPase subunit C/Vma6
VTSWAALAARARGLATHLLDAATLARIQRAATLAETTRELRATAYAPYLTGREAGAIGVERAITRSLGDRVTTLSRWVRPDGRELDAIHLELDARNLRALLRGSAAGVAPDDRLVGIVPTPILSRRALDVLARAETPGRVAATLVAWGHPIGAPLLEETGRRTPDLFRLETALARAFAAAALVAGRAAGRAVHGHVVELIDVRNASAALSFVGGRVEGPPREHYVEGGHITQNDFERAAGSPDEVRAAAILSEACRGSVVAAVLAARPSGPAALTGAVPTERIERLRRKALLEPTSALPVLLFVSRLRVEASQLRRALWRASLS